MRSTGGTWRGDRSPYTPSLQQLDESDDRVERRAQLVRDVREELALRRVRARDFAVQPLELRRPLGDAHRLAPLANEAEAEEHDRRRD